MKDKLTLDGAGRMVLPRSIRDQFGLRRGAELEIRVGTDAIILIPVAARPSLTKTEGLYVHEGSPVEPLLDAVETARDARDRSVWGASL